MYEYAISFTIKSDSSYSHRYDSLMEQIRATPDGKVWTETTSFALVSSSEAATAFANRLYFQSDILSDKDILIVFDHHNGICIARGPIEFPATLRSHFSQISIA